MYNYLMGSSYKNKEQEPSYKLPSPIISPVLGPIKLPDIHNNNNRLNRFHNKQQLDNCCVTCNLHKSQGCTNNIKKNGNKIWYVLHNLVESIKTPKITSEQFEILCTTILSIIKSIPCKECASHSILWYNTVIKNNTKLHNRIHFIYEIWKHHDDVTKRLLMINPSIIINRITWNNYKNQIEINKITCSNNYTNL
jgi:hypothetical protein